MKLKIKLLPPYYKKGDPDERIFYLEGEAVDLNQLARRMAEEWRGYFNYPLIDENDLLTAEFMVNGRHAPMDTALREGDLVTVIPYIAGG